MRMLSALVLAAFTSGFATAADIKLTGDNTKIEWTGTKKGGKHDGGFKTLTGSANAEKLAFNVEIEIDSLYSDDKGLTGHLKGSDFFDAKTHPKAKFASKKVDKTDKGHTVTGDLTLLGKTKEISFPAKIVASGGAIKLEADFSINRSDYGMKFGLDKVDDAVAIRVKLDAK